MALTRTKKLTDPNYSPTAPASEEAIRTQIDDSIQEAHDLALEDVTINRKLSATGDFTGTINGGDVTLTEPGLSGAFNAHLADMAKVFVNVLSPPMPIAKAPNNGVDDDSVAINACVDWLFARGGGVVFTPNTGTDYKILNSVIQKSGVYIISNGATWDTSELTPLDTQKYAIRAAGTLEDSILLTADAVKGTDSITLESVTGLTAGDYVQLASTGDYFPHTGSGGEVDRGEIKRIRKIESLTVYFEEIIYDNYTMAYAPFIKKINFVEDVKVKGIKIKGAPGSNDLEHGIYYTYVNNFVIDETDIEDVDLYLIGLASCIRGEVKSNHLRSTLYESEGSIFYGIAVMDCCQWIRVHHNHAERVRHLWVCSSRTQGQGYWGYPRFITVDGNIAKDMMINASGRSYAYEHHGYGDNVVCINNIADGCYSGFDIDGGGITVARNIIRNVYGTGISITDSCADARNIHIEDNSIESINAVQAGGLYAIWCNFATGITPINITIKNNKIRWAAAKTAIRIQGAIANCKNLIVENNDIQPIGASIGTAYAIINLCKNVVMADNRFANWASLINNDGDFSIIKGNTVINARGDATAGYGILDTSDKSIIDGNVLEGIYQGIGLTGDSSNAVVSNNVIRADAVTISDISTGAIKQNNVEVVY
jgi:hypothetical protein